MYIDGYAIPVPEVKKQACLEMAEWFDGRMCEFGALEVTECRELHIPEGQRTDWRKAVLAEEGEKVVLAWIVWSDKATADAAHDRGRVRAAAADRRQCGRGRQPKRLTCM